MAIANEWKHAQEGDYHIRYRPYDPTCIRVYIVNFEVREVVRVTPPDKIQRLEFPVKGGTCKADSTSDIEKSEVFLTGDIKWDGCSNWMFEENSDNCYLHFCGSKFIAELFNVFRKMYEIARELTDSEDCK